MSAYDESLKNIMLDEDSDNANTPEYRFKLKMNEKPKTVTYA